MFRLVFSDIESKDHRRRRLFGIVQGVITSLGNRIIGLLVSFLSVPLTINYLGRERYGAWVMLGSLLTWLQLTDFVLENGLTNSITTAAGQDRPDLVRMNVSNGVFLLSALAGASGLVAAAAWPFLDWSAFFGVSSAEARAEIGPAVALAFAILLLQLPLSVAGKVFMAYHEGRIGNYWGAAGNVLSLVALVLVTRTQGNLVWLVVALSGTSLLVNLACSAWLFLVHRPYLWPQFRHVEFASIGALSQIGGQFFLMQIMALITFQTDNIIIGHYLGAAQVPQYSITYRLFGYASLPQNIIFSYLWTAYSEAIARKDIKWVERAFYTNLVLGLAFAILAVIGLGFIAKPFIGWWARPEVIPSTALIAWMAAWSIVNAFATPIACLLAAAAHLRLQMIYGAIAAASNLFLSLTLVKIWGPEGVIAGTVIAYGIFVCIPVFIDSQMLLRRLRDKSQTIQQGDLTAVTQGNE
jgi:O-antigen/teichoic acid export membrane protein